MSGNWERITHFYQRILDEREIDEFRDFAQGMLNLLDMLRNNPDFSHLTLTTAMYNLVISVPDSQKLIHIGCENPTTYLVSTTGFQDKIIISDKDILSWLKESLA